MNVPGLLAAAVMLLPGDAQPNPLSSCVALVLPSSGEIDKITVETLDRFVSWSWMTRDRRKLMAIYAPRREEAIRAHMVGRGVDADRIRLIGLEEGASRFGRVPERAVVVSVQSPGADDPFCDTSRISRSD